MRQIVKARESDGEENERRESLSQNNTHNSMACQTYRQRVRKMGGGIGERFTLT